MNLSKDVVCEGGLSLDLVVIREKERAWAEEIKIPLGGVAENLWSPQAPTPPARRRVVGHLSCWFSVANAILWAGFAFGVGGLRLTPDISLSQAEPQVRFFWSTVLSGWERCLHAFQVTTTSSAHVKQGLAVPDPRVSFAAAHQRPSSFVSRGPSAIAKPCRNHHDPPFTPTANPGPCF